MTQNPSENSDHESQSNREDPRRRLRQHAEYQVACIQQEPGTHGRHRISQLGIRLGEEVVLLDVEEIVELVRMGKRFYVERGSAHEPYERRPDRMEERAYLETRLSEDGRPYVETRADRSLMDNLTSLGDCGEFRSEETPEVEETIIESAGPGGKVIEVMEFETEAPRRDRDPEDPVDGDEDDQRPRRRYGLWLAGALVLAAIAGLGILLAIASVAFLAQTTLLIIGIAALVLLVLWLLLSRGTWRQVYHAHFHRRRSGWALLLGLLLLFILALLIFPASTPTIAFAPIPDKTYLDPDFKVTAAESDHQPVYFTASGSNFCTVTRDGTVHIVNAGGCAITAVSQNHPKVASVSRTFAIGRKTQTISFTQSNGKTYGDPDFAVTASADSGLPLVFTTSGPCAVAGSQIHILSAGDCAVTAHQGGNMDYLDAADASQTIHIAQAAQTITFGPVAKQSLGAGALAVDATASSKLPVSFSTPDGTVCKASGGAIELVSVGACTVTAHQVGDVDFAPAVDVTQAFDVSVAPKQDQAISFGALSSTVYGKPDFGINASASSGLAVSFTADGQCSVNGNIVKITGAGGCTITAHQTGNDEFNPAPDVSQPLTIAKATPVISWGVDEIVYGIPLDPSQLNASAWNPSGSFTLVQGSFTYTPGEGTVLPVGEHTLHVVFTPVDTADYNGPVSADVTLDVEPTPADN